MQEENMKRNLFLSVMALAFVAAAILLIVLPNTPVLAHNSIPLETPTPDATQVVQNANNAITHAQDLLNVVNIFATILAAVLTFLGVVAGILTFLGIRSIREVRASADELRKSVKDVQTEARDTIEALVYLGAGNVHLERNNREEALENFRKAGSLLPKDSRMNYLLGSIYSGLGEFDAAIIALEASRPEETLTQGKVQKELGLAYRRRGEALGQEDDYDKAIQFLKKAISLNPDDSDTFAILGGLYRRKKEYKQALASYEQAWNLNPNSSYALGNLASLSWYLGKVNEAKMHFQYAEMLVNKRIKRGQPVGFWDYYDLALAQLASGNLADAKKMYTEAIKATPGPVQIDGVLNNLYLLQNANPPLPGLDEIVKMLEDAKTA